MAPPSGNVAEVDPKIKKKRRERGRRAQSAFRKRQSQAKVDLGFENNVLRQALEAIIRESTEDDRPALLRKVQEAAEMLQGLSQRQFSALSQGGTSSLGSNDEVSSASSSAPDIVKTSATSLHETNGDVDSFRYQFQPLPNMQTFTSSSADTVSPQDRMFCRSPWDRSASDDWISTVMPFFGPGAFTLAGRIFWRLMSSWEARTNSHMDAQLRVQSAGPRFIKLQSARHGTLCHQLDYPSKVFNTAEWMQAINTRLNYDIENGMLKIREPSSRKKAERWLTPTQIEERLRYVVGNEVYAVLTRPVLDRWETSRNIQFGRAQSPASMLDYTLSDDPCDVFLDWVVENFTCFGDGPRWNQDRFDEGLKAWVAKLTGLS